MADRYWVTGGNGNTNSTTNWSDSSGGASGFSVPTSADNAIWDINSGSGTSTVNALLSCLSINCTGFTGTLTGSSNINVSGSVTFDAGMTLTCTGLLTVVGTATLNWGGLTWGGAMTWTGNVTKTLTSDIAITGNFIVGGSTTTAGAFNFYIGGSFTPSFSITGTATIILNGTGTWSTGGGAVLTNLTINTAGTITISGNVYFGTNKFLYVAGTMVVTGSTFNTQGNYTIDASGMTFNNFGTFTTGTVTIQSNINISGQLTLIAALITSGAFTIYVGGITATGGISGSASIIVNSTGTWSGSGILSIPMEINTAGTLTITGTVTKSVSSPIYTAGTVNTGTSTIQLNGSMTLSTTLASITFYNLGLHAAVGNDTFILSSDIYVTNNIVITGAAANPRTTGIYNLYTGGLTLTSGNFFTTEATTSCATIIFNGTGSWTQVSTNFAIGLNVTINTSGTLTLGTGIRTTTGRVTYITGTVITAGNTYYVTSGELDTNVLAWNNVQSDSNGTITLISDFNIAGSYTVATFTATINGLFNINIGGNLSCTSSGTLTGSATIKLVGTGVVTVGSNTIRTNLIIDTSGTITFSGTVSYRDGTFTYRRGKVIAGTATLYIALSCTLINIHKIVFGYVTILGGQLIHMNEFFSGSANVRTRIASTNTTNYIITFQDGFEKISKFVRISNATITNRGQLLVITDKANANTAGAANLGVRYNNTIPNGISKSNPSANLQACFGIDDGFCVEPLSKN